MLNIVDQYIIETIKKMTNGVDIAGKIDALGVQLFDADGSTRDLMTVMKELGEALERYDPDAKANADYDAGYREGMHEAWQAAKKIALIEELGGMTPTEIWTVFGMGGPRVFEEMDPADVIEKVNRYERMKERDAKEIHIGDEVSGVGGTWIVTLMKDGQCYGIDSNGDTHGDLMKDLTKTGRSFPELVEAIRRIKEKQGDEA